jgi:hypothetical protein
MNVKKFPMSPREVPDATPADFTYRIALTIKKMGVSVPPLPHNVQELRQDPSSSRIHTKTTGRVHV